MRNSRSSSCQDHGNLRLQASRLESVSTSRDELCAFRIIQAAKRQTPHSCQQLVHELCNDIPELPPKWQLHARRIDYYSFKQGRPGLPLPLGISVQPGVSRVSRVERFTFDLPPVRRLRRRRATELSLAACRVSCVCGFEFPNVPLCRPSPLSLVPQVQGGFVSASLPVIRLVSAR